jgi:hypothetical protein
MVGAGFTDELLRSPVSRLCLPEVALLLDAETAETALDWPNAGCARLVRGVVAAGEQRGGVRFGSLRVTQRNVVLFRHALVPTNCRRP